jgi:hypothetical protein
LAHSLAQVLKFPLVTSDRRKPAIRGLLFDDRSWFIRYVVANAGSRFSPCLVAVPAASLNTPDWSRQVVETSVTFDQLSGGPGAEAVRPVSRQQQLAWNRHFGWCDRETYYDNSLPPAFPRQEFCEMDGKDDPHLRSSTDLISYQVWDCGGYLGLLEDFFLDDVSWHIGSLLVKSGDWIYHEEVMPSSSVMAISWGQGRVVVERAAHAC